MVVCAIMKNNNHKKEERLTNLKKLRQELGMTQQQFANAIGVSDTAVANCEQGRTELTFTAASMKKLDSLMNTKFGFGIEVLPDSLKEISNESIFSRAS